MFSSSFFLFISVSLSYIPTPLPSYLSIHPSACLPAWPSLYSAVFLSIHPSNYIFTYISIIFNSLYLDIILSYFFLSHHFNFFVTTDSFTVLRLLLSLLPIFVCYFPPFLLLSWICIYLSVVFSFLCSLGILCSIPCIISPSVTTANALSFPGSTYQALILYRTSQEMSVSWEVWKYSGR